MKILCINNDKYIIYLNKYYCECTKENIEECLAKIFIRLKTLYNIEVHSIFNIKCFINKVFGTILEIEKEYDPFSLYTKKTNANIKFFNDTKVLYEINDYFLKNRINNEVYNCEDKYYIEALDEDINIIEHINTIIYGNKAEVIMSMN